MKTVTVRKGTQTTIVTMAAIAITLAAGQSYRSLYVRAAASFPDPPFAESPQESASKEDAVPLVERLEAISKRAAADVGIAISLHGAGVFPEPRKGKHRLG
ncbi:MAG TPA: hypothetical protein VJ124_00300 [Pyrinomonadaceae bacterium]|nr:hypothetical protein [Pyrinomonadaceae bacterium]